MDNLPEARNLGIGKFFIVKRALQKPSPLVFISWLGASFYNEIKTHGSSSTLRNGFSRAVKDRARRNFG
jgi:hypothetical protein